ncbi:hypothetical protein BASA60_001594 [Batrachochytrium salamandrivorans]|nr:hypothetical protein BASA60_001594 [Batrachochytrium salamandrivorans]
MDMTAAEREKSLGFLHHVRLELDDDQRSIEIQLLGVSRFNSVKIYFSMPVGSFLRAGASLTLDWAGLWMLWPQMHRAVERRRCPEHLLRANEQRMPVAATSKYGDSPVAPSIHGSFRIIA